MVTHAMEEIETNYFSRFGDQRGGKEWGTYTFEWFSDPSEWTPLDEDTTGWDEDDFEEFRQEKEHELVQAMLENPNSGLYRAIENNQTEATDEEFQTSYRVRDEDGDVVKLDLYFTWGEPYNVEQRIKYYDKEPLYRLEFYAENMITDAKHGFSAKSGKKMNPLEKAEVSGIASGATMEGLEMLASEEPPEKDDPLESWMEDYDAEEPSAYEFVKEEIIKASPITESEVNRFLDKLSNVPMSYLKEARSEAIKLQDEMAVGIITMAINRRSFREEWASEEDDYVEMMVCAFCEEFGDGKIPTGVDIDSGDRWNPPTADITGWEICEYCEGKGEVEDTPENQKIPNWDWDYLLPDEPDYDRYDDRYDDWDAESNEDAILRQQAIDTIEARVADYTTHEDVSPYWGGGMVNPNQYLYFKLRYAWENHPEQKEEIIQQYMRGIKDGRIDPSNPLPHGSPNQHLPSIHSAEETNGDKQLELAVKRTQMSALRTGLAITTFGIVLWNLWTNKKQEKQISDIMGLV